MRPARAVAFIMIALTLAWAGSVLAASSTLDFQGQLKDSGGSPVADGNYAVTFSLWTEPVGGSLIWTELQDVHVTGGEGLFTTHLGSVQPLGGPLVMHANDDLYIQMALSGEVLSPRLAIGAVPQAFSSSSVHHVEPGVGAMEMSVGADTTKAHLTHEGASTLIESMVHLADDRSFIGLREYDPTLSYIVGDDVVIEDNLAEADLYYDDDADGIADVSVWEKVDNTGSICGTTVDVDDDGDPDVGSTSSGKLTRAVLKTFFQTGDFPTQSQFMDSADATGAHHSTESSGPDASSSSKMRVRINDLESKLQSIGLLARSSITNSLTPTTCGVAINTKGTGAAKGRTIGSTCDDSSAVQVLDVDDDGDGVAECRGIISVKGSTGSGSMSASSRMMCDSDEDGVPENEVSQIVTPTKSAVLVQSKGTDDDAQRRIGGTCDDSSALQVIEVDDDGDGHAEAKAAVSSVSSLGGGGGGGAASSAYARMTADPDEDGDPENEATMMVTPTTSSVAINTKGTGADKNRVVGSTDDSTAVMLLATDSASISMITRKGGMVNGTINVNNGSALRMAGLGSDGNGYLATGLGIGMDPTHPIDVSGGAYCDGANWVNASDVNAKENFQPIDGEEILEKIDELEITRWNYKADKTTEHIGPTAQDFKHTFGVGSDGKSISTIDPSGIALAAIKELNKQNRSLLEQSNDLAAQNRTLLEQNALLKQQMEELARKVERLAASR